MAYDAWGNPVSVSDTFLDGFAELNPLRYSGYVYDQETGLYYLQSRYYNAKVGRFLNADAFASTGQGVLGHNVFVYCLNNPVLLSDPRGMLANNFLFSPHMLDEDEQRRDVTDEILSVLTDAARRARSMRAAANQYSLFSAKYWEIVGSIYLEFRSLVDHGACWDIKREEVWKSTIGTAYPGFNTEVIFAGNIMTPESLGNFTYGYLGYAYGIPLEVLIGGSYYAAGFPTVQLHGDNSACVNEVGDWMYIAMGYEYAKNGYLEGMRT